MVQEPLRVGRLRRARYDALCETAGKKRHPGRLGNPLRGLDRTPTAATAVDRERVPTCRACLQIADRLSQ